MSQDYMVIRGGKRVTPCRYYCEESANQVADAELMLHPKATVYIVKIVCTKTGVKAKDKQKKIKYTKSCGNVFADLDIKL